MNDDIDIGAFGDILEEADSGFAGAAEAQPVMGGHQQDAVGADFLGCQRLGDGFIAAFGADAGDHLDLGADFISDDLGDAGALVVAQGHDLASVAVADQAGDAIDRGEVGRIFAQADLVNGVVFVERT